MAELLEKAGGELLQADAVAALESQFGEQCVFYNEQGNPAILRPVLSEFEKLTGDGVVWSRSGRYWRRRMSTDLPGRSQD